MALESLAAVLGLKPDFGPAHMARIEMLYLMGRREEVRRALLAARAALVEVDPELASRVAK